MTNTAEPSSPTLSFPDVTNLLTPSVLNRALNASGVGLFAIREQSPGVYGWEHLAGVTTVFPFLRSADFLRDASAAFLSEAIDNLILHLQSGSQSRWSLEVALTQPRRVLHWVQFPHPDWPQIALVCLSDQTQAADHREYLLSLFDNMASMMWVKDREGRIQFANQAYYDWTGQSSAGVTGQHESEWLPSTEVDAFLEEDRRVMASGLRLENEGPASNQRGEVRWFESWKSPVVSHGEVIGTMGFARDVTTQRNVESEVRLKEILLEHARDMVLLVALSSPMQLSYVNREACLVLGYDHAELLALPLENLDGGELVRQINAAGQNAISAERIRFEASCRRRDGALVPVEVTGAHLLFEDALYFLAMLRDISAQKQAENTLREREQEFRTLAENSSDSIARFDAQQRIRYVNPAFISTFGCVPQTVHGRTPQELFGPTDGALYQRYLGQTLQSAEACQFELFWQGADGGHLCVLIRLTPELDHDGRVISVLAIGRDVSELNEYRQKVHHLAFFDNLTGLPNRAMFQDCLSQMLQNASRWGRHSAVMLIDLDLFKEVNDTLGHPVGDQLLCQVSQRLKSKLRSNDLLARLGGDEFALLLPDVPHREDLQLLAEKLLATFETPFWLGGREMFITGSVGIAFYPEDADSAEDLVKYADAAMYAAKRAGRNGYRFYASEMTRIANERLALELELRQALARQQMALFFQPKISLDDGAVIGSEALIRWQHPEWGLVSPDRFIPLAEESALIVEIGRWVLREACLTVADWNRHYTSPHRMAVNLSARQFHSSRLVDEIPLILEATGCQPEWLELEITESLLLAEDEQVLTDLQRLRILGVTIAIDDFGTGFSALSYLTRFPIDTLKIDRSFIHSVNKDPYKAGLVRAMISMAECLGQTVVAEGVEDMDQVVFLRQNGCHMAQGFLFGKPVPKAEFERFPSRFDVPLDDYML